MLISHTNTTAHRVHSAGPANANAYRITLNFSEAKLSHAFDMHCSAEGALQTNQISHPPFANICKDSTVFEAIEKSISKDILPCQQSVG